MVTIQESYNVEVETAKEVQADNDMDNDMETVSEQRIVPFWYRGSLFLNETAGNGQLPIEENAQSVQVQS